MRKSSRYTRNRKSQIECVEVLIPKNFIVRSSHNLSWTLSIYSLENQPVQVSPEDHHSLLFHFMAFDWEKTIKQLLESLQVPYSVLQHFTTGTIYPDAVAVEGQLIASLEKAGEAKTASTGDDLENEEVAVEH